MQDNKKVAIIGGITMDLFYFVDSYPQEGSTIEAKKYILTPGGKGLNIATVLHRANIDVSLFSSVGKDKFSEEIFQTMMQEGLDTDNIVIQENVPTDIIGVVVPPHGNPTFLGTRSANFALSDVDLLPLEKNMMQAGYLIATLEVPGKVIHKYFSLCRQSNITTILRASPLERISSEIFPLVDYLIVSLKNMQQHEAYKNLTKEETGKKLLEAGVSTVILTDSENGCTLFEGENVTHFEAIKVDVADTTGAGDAFTGIFVKMLAENHTPYEAVQKSLQVSALTISKLGARDAMPTMEEIQNL